MFGGKTRLGKFLFIGAILTFAMSFSIASVLADTSIADPNVHQNWEPYPVMIPQHIPISMPDSGSSVNEPVIVYPTPTPTQTPVQSVPDQNASSGWQIIPIGDGRYIYIHPPYEHIPLVDPNTPPAKPVTTLTPPIPTPLSTPPADIPNPGVILPSNPIPVVTSSQSLFSSLISRISSSPVTVPVPAQSEGPSASAGPMLAEAARQGSGPDPFFYVDYVVPNRR
ncbi:hypothetical protein J2741_000320 [Methanolinea mesophila]|nr:hypothetical protein [Methanolinea mesophila]